MVFIFLSGINALCILSFGVFGAIKITLFGCVMQLFWSIYFFRCFCFAVKEFGSVSVDTVLDCRQKEVFVQLIQSD